MTTASDDHRRAWTTVSAATLIVLVTLPFLDAGIDLARGAFGAGGLTPRRTEAMIRLGITDADRQGLAGATAILTLALCAWAIVVSAGVMARREWARFGGMLTFSFFALMLLPLTIGGLGEADAAWLGVLVAAGQGFVVWLLWSRPTADDIDDAEWRRQRRRQDRGDAGLLRRFRLFIATVQPEDFRDA